MTVIYRTLICGVVLAGTGLLGACSPGVQTPLNAEIRGSDTSITRATALDAARPSPAR